jgi:hypothetical protein
MIVRNNAEFGVELALAVPYAYWLHEQGMLEEVVTSKGMTPFYYFAKNVREEFTYRTIDNAAAGLNELPNNWIHGDTKAGTVLTRPGVLDYSQWKLPPYKQYYQNDVFKFDRPAVFVTNIYNHPDPSDKRHYHHIPLKDLYDIFTSLDKLGYTVIYKRDNNKNTKITYDQNEVGAMQMGHIDLCADVDGYGIMTDYDMVKQLTNVILFDDLVEQMPSMSYNQIQLMVLANCDKYISVCGGSAILSSCFGGTVIIYVTQGKELRDNYFSDDGYFHQLSKAKIIPVIDPVTEIINRGAHSLSGVITAIHKEF